MNSAMSELAVASRCHHNDGMADWQRLAQHVVARRIALGYRTREALTDVADISPRTLGDIETGRRAKYHTNTVAALENALQWTPGSVNTVLAGGEATERQPTTAATPQVAPRTARDEALVGIMGDPRISDQDKMRIAQMLIDARERFARERVLHAEEPKAFRDDE
jgi:DNA-binding XRE family transcriptional regulator